MPLKLRPDHCKVVLLASDEAMQVQATVDPSHPNAWRANDLHQFLAQLANEGVNVSVSFGIGREKLLFIRQAPGVVATKRVSANEADEHGMQSWEKPVL